VDVISGLCSCIAPSTFWLHAVRTETESVMMIIERSSFACRCCAWAQ